MSYVRRIGVIAFHSGALMPMFKRACVVLAVIVASACGR